jgi:hypothetical protein
LPSLEELRAHPDLDPIRLELGGEPLSISGRVEDTHGNPIAGVEVWPIDGTKFGRITFKYGLEGTTRPATIETMLRGGSQAEKARSNESGRFVLDGLCDREYALLAFDSPTMRSARIDPVRSGQRDVVLQLRAQEELVHIAGRVVRDSGEPVAGVLVHCNVNLTSDFTPSPGPSMMTNEEGRFDFLAEANPSLRFSASSESIVPVIAYQPMSGEPLDKLEIHAWLRCHLQVDLGARKSSADHFTALDAAGEATQIMIMHGPMMRFAKFGPIADGKSEAAVVRDSCRTIVLYKGSEEVGRVPVSLRPGELNVINW